MTNTHYFTLQAEKQTKNAMITQTTTRKDTRKKYLSL